MTDPTKSPSGAVPSGGTGAQAVDPLIGRTINERFKILSVIARGGMGKVYKAEQAPLGRVCAVKVLNPNYNGDTDPEFHKRFFLEASIASKLSHPNTVTIFDYGRTDDDVYYMAMEYLEGRTLHKLIKDERTLEPARALHIARQICKSLTEAHGLNVIHRDLKPANIYLIKHDEENDFVKVLDFGLVKNVEDNNAESLTQTGLFMGSPKYMAPEQIRGEKVGPCTDIYALGVVLYEMLVGKVPFDRGNSVNTLMAHVSEPVPRMSEMNPGVSVPYPVEEVVMRCLEKRDDDRYASMQELLVALRRAGELSYGGSGTAEFQAGGSIAISGENALRSTGNHDAYNPKTSQTGLSTASMALRISPSNSPPANGGGVPSMTPGGITDSTHTPLTAAVSVPEEAPAKGPKMGLLLAGVGLVAVLGGAAVFGVTRGNTSAGRANPSAATTASGATTSAAGLDPSGTSAGAGANASASATGAPSAVEAPRERSQRVVLDSTPPGAEVFEGTRSLGRTPLRLEWMGEQADPTRAHTFTFRLANFRDANVTLQGSTLEYAAPLVAAPRVARPSARPRPSGYRDLPDDWR